MNISLNQPSTAFRRKQTRFLNVLASGLLFITAVHGKADVFVITLDASSTVASGTPMVIRWSDDLETPLVNVELWDGVRGTTSVLARNVAAPQREISWTVPEDVETGDRYRFVVRDARNTSRAIFSVGFTGLVRRAATPSSVVESTSLAGIIDVAPMPATDRIRLSWTQTVRRIEIIDLTGVVVVRLEPASGAQACSVNVSTLRSGTYIIVAYTGSGGVIRRSLLVQR